MVLYTHMNGIGSDRILRVPFDPIFLLTLRREDRCSVHTLKRTTKEQREGVSNSFWYLCAVVHALYSHERRSIDPSKQVLHCITILASRRDVSHQSGVLFGQERAPHDCVVVRAESDHALVVGPEEVDGAQPHPVAADEARPQPAALRLGAGMGWGTRAGGGEGQDGKMCNASS